MTFRIPMGLTLALLCLNGCSSTSSETEGDRGRPVTVVHAESFSDGVTVSAASAGGRDDLVTVEATNGDLLLPGSGQLVWERKDGQVWEPAFDGPFSSDANVAPPPAHDYAAVEFQNAGGMLAKTVVLSTPRTTGIYRACTIDGDCVSVELDH